MSAWTPANITTAMWYDASDAATIVSDANGVSAWNDKSGKARNMLQSTNAYKPTLISGLTSYVMRFDGVNDFLQNSYTGNLISSSIFAVIVPRSGQGFSGHLLSRSSYYAAAATDFPFKLDVAADGSNLNLLLDSGNDYSTDVSISSGSSSLTPDSAALLGVITNPTTGTAFIYINGQQKVTGASVTQAAGSRAWTLGRAAYENGGGVGTSAFKGDIAEVVIVASVTGERMREFIEGYLAHKWGLVSSLPSSHRFKLAAPDTLLDTAANTLSGTVTKNGSAAVRTVAAIPRSWPQETRVTTSAADGTFSLAVPNTPCSVVCFDDGTPDENALILDNITPV